MLSKPIFRLITEDVKSKENPQDLQLIGNKPPPNASSDAKPSN